MLQFISPLVIILDAEYQNSPIDIQNSLKDKLESKKV